jgi:prefoldin subunit 5
VISTVLAWLSHRRWLVAELRNSNDTVRRYRERCRSLEAAVAEQRAHIAELDRQIESLTQINVDLLELAAQDGRR